MSAVEVEISDSDVVEFLDETYPDPVIVCGMSMQQSYILKELDDTVSKLKRRDYNG